jgi:hypothetical protein
MAMDEIGEKHRGGVAGNVFEFEAGKGNDGTKILMIEWEDDDLTRSKTDGSWHVSWDADIDRLPPAGPRGVSSSANSLSGVKVGGA